jgi:hypothetical protein
MKIRVKNLLVALALLAISTLNSQFSTVFAQGTAFTYQGRLNSSTNPASGTYNLTFSLFNTNASGVAIAGPVTNNAVSVTNGLFTVLIDFGPGVFTGQTNWLQIGVETNGVSSFTTLTPRQQLTPTPYAIYAENANNLSGTLPASQLTSIGNTNGGANGNFFVGPSGNSTTSGFGNTANGTSALGDNTSGNNNTANGFSALGNNTSGGGNTGNGVEVLNYNTSGGDNTANGLQALFLNTSGSFNTANGVNALYSNMNGSLNTANGVNALYSNTNGSDNTANGFAALANNTSGFYNIALGYLAGANLTTGSSNIDIGNQGLATDTNIIRIGSGQSQTFIAGVINGNGGGLTNLNVSTAQLSGTLANSQLANSSITVNAGTGLSGGGAVALGGSTTLNNAGVLSVTGNADITATTVGGAVTLGDTATSSATPGTLVKRDASGNFSAGLITATNFSGAFNGNGGGLTNLNASQLISIGNTNGGIGNFFVGLAGNSTTSGAGNTAVGLHALYFNSNGTFNMASGEEALYSNTTGSDNTAVGVQALNLNTSGFNNIALGYQAGYHITTGSSNIDIGNQGFSTDANIIRIGSGQSQTFIAGVITNTGTQTLQAGTDMVLRANNNMTATAAADMDLTANNNMTESIGANMGVTANNNVNITAGLAADLKSGTTMLLQSGGSMQVQSAAGVTLSGTLFSLNGGNVGIGTSSPQQALSVVGGLNLDQNGLNNGTFNLPEGAASSACLSFGNDSGEGIASQRTSGANQYDLFFCTEFTPRITILATGNVGIGITNPAALLQVGSATCNGTTWANGSDRNSKEDFAVINPRTVLEKVSALPITEWKYKVEADGTEHLGPMAQDFHAAFGLNGTDDKHIATVDEEGVALAAIQGLNQKLNEKDAEIQDLKRQNDSFAKRLNQLESVVESLANGK